MQIAWQKILDAPIGKTWLFWLGQAGFVIKSTDGKMLGIDLYLSDCVEYVEGHIGYHRLMPKIVDPSEMELDVVIATHFHRDHYDIDSIPSLMSNGRTKLLCSCDCKDDVYAQGIDIARTSFVRPGDTIDMSGFTISFVHSDHGTAAPMEVAPLISVDGKIILETGDTSLHLEWREEYLKNGNLDVLIAPINGAYGNLNERENVQLTKALKPNISVPCHFGMFASHGGQPNLWMKLMEKELPYQPYKLFTMGEGIEI